MRDLAPGPHDGPPGRSIDAGSPAEVERAIEAIAPLDARWCRTPTWSFGDGWIPTGSCRWRPPNPNLRPTLRRNGTGSIEPKTVTSLREIHTAFFN